MLDQNLKILLVDDENSIIEACSEFLINLGYPEPYVANSGSEALKTALLKKPDLILMDINLKGSMTGIEAAEAIQAKGLKPCLVFLTGQGSGEWIDRASCAAAPQAYLLKPINGLNLHASIQVAMANHRNKEALMAQKLATEKAMKKYTAIFENSLVGICFVDGNGIIEAINRRGVEILGGRASGELVGEDLLHFHDSIMSLEAVSANSGTDRGESEDLSDDSSKLKDVLSASVNNGRVDFRKLYEKLLYSGPIVHLEHTITKLNGQTANLIISASAIAVGDGPGGVVWVYEDVTEMRELEATRNSNQRLMGAMEMAGALAHEMNQSLQYILGYSQLLVEDIKDTTKLCDCVDNPVFREMEDSAVKIGAAAFKVGEITSRMARVSRYATKEYLPGTHIIDLDAASGKGLEE
ncbi:MAG: hypothetical protein CVV64_12970 [Candidatus Wallbacteria bacterium HGW-Wallbacteria-1]|jgi:CheY-like chemotaxis protein|uniref:Response regulatory domain-containing protein n=1 Tax=Candidatus Wallbacteria bacterium HGW-Wallbacteria-1 TaxID=2013854 RepID=A0A2N1PMY1_9BACT|nr:MAG: hypothetical protein CVV64_12970 [Candidatus Wallbacteria bacterium HGW-Wallbacteria-1]